MAVNTATTTQLEAARAACEVRWCGTVSYARGLELQEELVRRRAENAIPDQLLLVEHPHVLTLGRDAKALHVLVSPEKLQELHVEQYDCGRGGDVTYHGPGQLVAYPILDLRPDRCDLHRYVRDLEAVMLAVLADYGVRGHVVPGRTGVWVQRDGAPEAKIGAIGVRVSRWITSHGIALNVGTDLRYFDLIVPCGLTGSAVTRLADLVPGSLSVEAVGQRFVTHFARIFQRQVIERHAS